MSKFLTIVLLFICIVSGYSQKEKMKEADYSNYIQTLIGGEREVYVSGGRVDLVTEEHAFEIEWANKWKESIGQALWYAVQTTKKPGIILILKDASQYKYFIQLNTALDYAGLTDKVDVFLFPNDFKAFLKKD